MAKFRALITGDNNSVINDFFYTMGENFECVTSSDRFEDLENHIRFFSPDVFVCCISSASRELITRVFSLKLEMTKKDVPFALIGEKTECEKFFKAGESVKPDIMIVRPFTASSIQDELLKFLRKKKYIEEKKMEEERKRLEEEENSQNSDSISDLLADLEDLAKAKKEEQQVPEVVHKEGTERRHILIIDDDPLMLKIIKRYLGEEYDVATAISGKLAYRFLSKRKTDLIFLDYEMPEDNGPTVLANLRKDQATANIPVVFLTGVSDRDKIQDVLALKPQGYLLKPIDYAKLQDMIKKVLG